MSDEPITRKCGTPEVHHRLLESPLYQARSLQLEGYTAKFVNSVGSLRVAGPLRIPVVVHVVYSSDDQNISDAQIRSQIDVLNADYTAANADRSQVPDVWTSVVGDAQLEFALASADPSGNPTDGITRTRTTLTSFTTDDAVKSAATGGADPWPSAHYLNIWVCKLGGGLLGYAQFPGGPEATDGLVILSTAFGTTGTAAPPFNLGRTAVHEAGHWLNLIHIWGDVIGCTGTDFVADTPQAHNPNYGTPAFPHVSCDNGPNGDMFMNYMDYVDDVAMFMFTSGQVARIQATITGPRATVVQTATPSAAMFAPAPGIERESMTAPPAWYGWSE